VAKFRLEIERSRGCVPDYIFFYFYRPKIANITMINMKTIIHNKHDNKYRNSSCFTKCSILSELICVPHLGQ